MKPLLSIILLPLLLAGCSQTVDERADEYVDLSFTLCGAKVKTYSQGDDGKIRVICENDSYFLVKDKETLAYMNELNGAYCYGKGFSVFNERSNYYTFTCKDEKSFNIPK
ncbi:MULTISPECIES: hypothetical protein [Photobacterium]|uniref:Lipoprotein n=1 Tax=Photobacterium alginatilyticum TaxID=1775171 RepID=A0ABW9YHF1_9GAMM|nr:MULTISPECIES: hypothetical protein [Photobacterium]MCG7587146.1 hypothetical protein [Photobacterium sp. OFAV2-7]NBI53242.1 hypothetical protein [Photobacterium alginatilyticum]